MFVSKQALIEQAQLIESCANQQGQTVLPLPCAEAIRKALIQPITLYEEDVAPRGSFRGDMSFEAKSCVDVVTEGAGILVCFVQRIVLVADG